MRRIKAENNKIYEVPVFLIISDDKEGKNAIFSSFFAAVESIYGKGWGRKGIQTVYVDEWNTNVDIPNNPFLYVHPVGEEYYQQYNEMVQQAKIKFQQSGAKIFPGQSVEYHPLIREKVSSSVSMSAFPLPYLLTYYPTSQLATNDVPRNEQWKLIQEMVHQLHRKRAWLDAIFVDAVNHDKYHPEESYKASCIPEVLENLPVSIFDSPEHLTELLIQDEKFLDVKEFKPQRKEK